MLVDMPALLLAFADWSWVVLDGGHAHDEGAVSFETALIAVVAVVALAGVLWYFGVFGSSPDADGFEGSGVTPTDAEDEAPRE